MGFDPEYFVSHTGETTRAVDDCLLCPVCQSVYDTPMVLDPCGHSFCQECVATLLNSGHENCPICRTRMIEGEGVGVPPNRALKELISNMTVRCMNCCPTDSNGNNSNTQNKKNCCSWTGKLSEFQSHAERDCPMQVVTCPIEGCNFEGPRWSMNQHNMDSIVLHTDLMIASKLEKIKEEILGVGIDDAGNTSSSNRVINKHQIDEFQEQLKQKDEEINMLKARLLDSWLSDFFREWILAKPPCFRDFVVYRPIKYLTGPVAQIIVGIPGPTDSDWEGGLYPLLLSFTPEGFERKEPPKCDFPRDFFHPNVYFGNVHVNTLAEFEGTWDPSISVPEILFCIQQLLTHPNHRGLYDPEEYRENVRDQAQKYNGADFLENAMVELQAKIDPEYKKPLEPWENVRWENLEEVRWKGIRSFQSRTDLLMQRNNRNQSNENHTEHDVVTADVVAASHSTEESLCLSEIEEKDTNNNDNDNNDENTAVVSPSNRSILAPLANVNNSADLRPSSSPSRRGQMMQIEAGRLISCDADGGNVSCKCSCCDQGSRHFLDREHKMRYFFGEGG